MILVDFNQVCISNIMQDIKNNSDIEEDLVRHMILSSLLMYKQKFGSQFGELVICCDDTSAAITFFTNLPGTQFFWTNTNVSIGLASSGVGNISQFISPCTGTVPNIGHLIIFGIGPNGCQSDTILGSITNEPMPTIISQPIGGTYCLNDSASSIDLITTSLGSGIVTNHQWYSSNNPISSIPPSGGTLINGAINPSFTPPTSTAGTTYYYCVVNKSGTICELVSDTCSVTVHDLPNVSIQCDLPYDTICDF